MALPLLETNEFWTPIDLINPGAEHHLVFSSRYGALYDADCLKILPCVQDGVVDTVFADPPFNLAKEYGSRVDDRLSEEDYIAWCRKWLDHCVRVLKPGGALFVYNLPKWNIHLGAYLAEGGMTFRHWIAVNIKLSLSADFRQTLSVPLRPALFHQGESKHLPPNPRVKLSHGDHNLLRYNC